MLNDMKWRHNAHVPPTRRGGDDSLQYTVSVHFSHLSFTPQTCTWQSLSHFSLYLALSRCLIFDYERNSPVSGWNEKSICNWQGLAHMKIGIDNFRIMEIHLKTLLWVVLIWWWELSSNFNPPLFIHKLLEPSSFQKRVWDVSVWFAFTTNDMPKKEKK